MKPSILLLFTVLLLLSCKKEPYVNLVATLTPENTVVATYEGTPLVMTLNFDKKLSEPIQLEGKIYNNYNHYINDNDYQHFLEYSTDLGAKLKKGEESFRVTIPKNTPHIKLRINTNDDNDVELHETFGFEISKAPNQPNVELLNNATPFELKVLDNEPVERNPSNEIIISFDVAGNQLKPLAVAEFLIFLDLKFLIDEKKYEEFFEKSAAVVNAYFDSERQVQTFEIFGSTRLQRYVFNEGSGTTNNWGMGLNAVAAYLEPLYNPFDEFIGLKRHDYNFNGEISYTLIHEAGHILSLNNGTNIDNTLETKDCGFIDNAKDCYRKDSWMTAFYNRFYNPDTKELTVEPEFVTEYASTQFREDVAETITVYTILKAEGRLPELEENSPTAIKKLHFIGQLAEIKPFAKAMYKTAPRINAPLYQKSAKSTANALFSATFNNYYKGKPISCLDVHRVLLEASN